MNAIEVLKADHADDQPLPPRLMRHPTLAWEGLRRLRRLGGSAGLTRVAAPTRRLGHFAKVGQQIAAAAVLRFRVASHDLEARQLRPTATLLQARVNARGSAHPRAQDTWHRLRRVGRRIPPHLYPGCDEVGGW
jgi:hypothetical protein